MPAYKFYFDQEDQRKIEVVNFRLTKKELEQLRQLAKKKEIALSDLIRKKLCL